MLEFGWLVFGSMLIWHVQTAYLGGLPIGEMMGVMGNSNSGAQNRVPQQSGGGGGGNATGAAASGNNSGGFASTIGNILRMFTGGSNTNRPAAAQSAQQSAQGQFAQRSPTIIPPVPGYAQQTIQSNQSNQSSQQASSQTNQSTRPIQTRRSDVQSNNTQQPSLQNVIAPVTNVSTQKPSAGFVSSQSQSPQPAASTVAILPVANIPSVSQNGENKASVNVLPRRMLRRPSAHLSASTGNASPLFPILESSNEQDIPSPP